MWWMETVVAKKSFDVCGKRVCTQYIGVFSARELDESRPGFIQG